MIKKLICFFLLSFCLKNKRRGFTLAEALIITVMTGACLLPILGTMQNAQIRTENYDHQSKMQMYARSRLTAEIANAAFDHKSINLEDEYHYIVYFASGTSDEPGKEEDAKLMELPHTYIPLNTLEDARKEEDISKWPEDLKSLLGIDEDKVTFPYLKIVHTYKTSVETKDNPSLAVFGAKDEQGKEIPVETPKALLGIVVKTCLLKSDEYTYDPSDGAMITAYKTDGSIKSKDSSISVLPVTLFSFVNLPTVSDEMIWLCDAYNWKLYGIDSVSRTVSSIIDLWSKAALAISAVRRERAYICIFD